jgi:hypothetical protein
MSTSRSILMYEEGVAVRWNLDATREKRPVNRPRSGLLHRSSSEKGFLFLTYQFPILGKAGTKDMKPQPENRRNRTCDSPRDSDRTTLADQCEQFPSKDRVGADERTGTTGDSGQSEPVNSFQQRRGRQHSHRGRSRLRQATLHYSEVAEGRRKEQHRHGDSGKQLLGRHAIVHWMQLVQP